MLVLVLELRRDPNHGVPKRAELVRYQVGDESKGLQAIDRSAMSEG